MRRASRARNETRSMDEYMDKSISPPSCEQAEDDLPPDLLDLALHVAAQPMPRPTEKDTALLVERLLAAGAVVAPPPAPGWAPSPTVLMRVARWRMRLLGPWFWIASVALIAMGATLSLVNSTAGNTFALILTVPLTGVLGLTYALRTTSSGLREVEAASAVSLVEGAVGLALALLGFDCAFGVLVTLMLALLRWVPFAALLVAWLGPLLLLTGISLPLALRWGTPATIIVGVGPWLALALGALVWPHGIPARLIASPVDHISLALHLVAVAVGACLLLLFLLRGSAWQRFLLASTTPLPA